MALSITKAKQNKLNYSELIQDPAIKHTTQPITTGSSVVAVKYNGGVIIGCDTLVSYGSMSKFKGVQRIEKISDNVALASTGEYSDFEELVRSLKEMKNEELLATDNIKYTPKEFGNYVARLQYYKRCKVDPYLLNNVVVGFSEEQGAYIATVDQFGTYVESDYATTGFAGYLCKPQIYNNWNKDIDEATARKIVQSCFTTLFYRDCRATDIIQIAVVDKNGVKVEDPQRVESKWDFKEYRDAASEKIFRQ